MKQFRRLTKTDGSKFFVRWDETEYDPKTGLCKEYAELPSDGLLLESQRGEFTEVFTDTCGGHAGGKNGPLVIDSTPVVRKSSIEERVKHYQKILNCGVQEAAIMAGVDSATVKELAEAAASPKEIRERAARWKKYSPFLTEAECKKLAELGREP